MTQGRFRRARVLSCVALATIMFTTEIHVQAAPPPDSILILGSSFVRRVKRPLKKMFKAAGYDVRIKARGPAFYTLERHLNSSKTMKTIMSYPWDVVMLAENSVGITSAQYPYAEGLHDIVASTGAQTMFFMTWRDKEDPLPAWDSLHGDPGGQFGYIPIAFQLDVAVSPVGWAVRKAKVDGLNPVDPWGKKRHLNTRGKYLAAATLYTTLTMESASEEGAPGGFEQEEIDYMHDTASEIVLDDPANWNLQ